MEIKFTLNMKAIIFIGYQYEQGIWYMFACVIYATELETWHYHFHLMDEYMKAQTG